MSKKPTKSEVARNQRDAELLREMSKFKVGDRVRVAEAVGCHAGKTNREFTITEINSDGWVFGGRASCPNPNNHLELVTTKQGEPTMGRRTFKLIKEAQFVSKGALYQEQCDDGTQPYEIITKELIKGTHTDGNFIVRDRSLVEEQPQWFVEVFQVEPRYMTREELDAYEAFKATLGKRKASKPAATQVKGKKTSYQWTPEQKAAQSKRIKAYWRKQRKAASQS